MEEEDSRIASDAMDVSVPIDPSARYVVDIALKRTYILYIPWKEALERCSPHNSRVFLHVQKRKSYIIKSHSYVK